MTTILPNPTTTTTIPPVTTTTNPNANAATVANAVDNTEIASNFTTFLQLLTTQLKNQDPLSPMDTNQFTQQLVEFAGVEQQMKTNTTLSTLVSLQQSAQTSQALTLVGANVVVNGTTAQLANGQATWMLNATQPATATVTITAPSGQTAFSATGAVNSGAQPFTWNGRRQRRHHVAGRQLHPDRDRGFEPAARSIADLHPGRGQGQFGRSHADAAGAVDRRAELHDQRDPADRRTKPVAEPAVTEPMRLAGVRVHSS